MTPINHYEGDRPNVITQHVMAGEVQFHGWRIGAEIFKSMIIMDTCVAIFRIKYKTL